MSSTAKIFTMILIIGITVNIMADLYAPALPAIANYFGVPINMPQWSIALFMTTVAISQLFYGPLSEVIGRKRTVLIGFIILFVGSILCSTASSMEQILIGRVVQGLGAGACAGLWRTIFRDSFEGEELAKYASYLTVCITLVVPVAPMLGGVLQATFDWRANFIFFVLYSLVAIILVAAFFKESNKTLSKSHLKLSNVISAYKELLTSSVFMGMSSCVLLGYGAFFAWFAVGAALLIDQLGMQPQNFGVLSAAIAGPPFAISGWLNGRYVKTLGMTRILYGAWITMTVAAIIMLVSYSIWGLTILGIALPLSLYFFGSTFIWPNAFAISFSPFGHIAGYAGALYGFMQLSGGGVASSIIAYMPDDTPIPFAMLLLVVPLISVVVFRSMVMPHLDPVK